MNLYLDTSALVKLLVEERGSSDVRQVFRSTERVASSRIAFAEACAGVSAAERSRGLSQVEARQAFRRLTRLWDDLLIVEVTQPLLETACRLCHDHPLRGFDSVHLASALAMAGPKSENLLFGCFDRRLRVAAAGTGLQVTPERLG